MNRKKILIIAGVIIIAVAGITALIKTSALNKETTEVSTEIEEITPEPTEEPAPTPEPTPEATEETEELEYIEEAKELWQEHKEEFICNDETFREAYIAERASGSDKEEAYKAVYEEFKVEEAEEEEGEQKEETKESEGQKEETTEQTMEQTPAPTEAPQQTSQSEPSSQDSGDSMADILEKAGLPEFNLEMTPGTGEATGLGADLGPGE